jgi:hypothetical protein
MGPEMSDKGIGDRLVAYQDRMEFKDDNHRPDLEQEGQEGEVGAPSCQVGSSGVPCSHEGRLMSLRPSVIFVRSSGEADCGCCRIPQGALPFENKDPAFAEQRAVIDRQSAVYRALRERFGADVDLQVMDPRNIALPITLIRVCFAHRVGLRDALRTLVQLPMRAIIVNGRIVDESDAPDEGAIMDLVARLLDAGTAENNHAEVGAGSSPRGRETW